MKMSPSDSQKAKIVAFPDLTPATRRDLMRGELGTEFDRYQMFGLYSGGDVFLGPTTEPSPAGTTA